MRTRGKEIKLSQASAPAKVSDMKDGEFLIAPHHINYDHATRSGGYDALRCFSKVGEQVLKRDVSTRHRPKQIVYDRFNGSIDPVWTITKSTTGTIDSYVYNNWNTARFQLPNIIDDWVAMTQVIDYDAEFDIYSGRIEVGSNANEVLFRYENGSQYIELGALNDATPWALRMTFYDGTNTYTDTINNTGQRFYLRLRYRPSQGDTKVRAFYSPFDGSLSDRSPLVRGWTNEVPSTVDVVPANAATQIVLKQINKSASNNQCFIYGFHEWPENFEFLYDPFTDNYSPGGDSYPLGADRWGHLHGDGGWSNGADYVIFDSYYTGDYLMHACVFGDGDFDVSNPLRYTDMDEVSGNWTIGLKVLDVTTGHYVETLLKWIQSSTQYDLVVNFYDGTLETITVSDIAYTVNSKFWMRFRQRSGDSRVRAFYSLTEPGSWTEVLPTLRSPQLTSDNYQYSFYALQYQASSRTIWWYGLEEIEE